MNVKKLPHDTDFQTRAVDIHTLLISIHIYRNNLLAALKYQFTITLVSFSDKTVAL